PHPGSARSPGAAGITQFKKGLRMGMYRFPALLKASAKPALIAIACMGLAALSPATLAADKAKSDKKAGEKQIDFAKDVQPIFKASCVKCHGEPKGNQGGPGG